MKRKNLLSLHEAIAVVLLKFPNWEASFDQVAEEIENRGLYPERKGGVDLSTQSFLRAKNYRHMFELTNRERVRLHYSGTGDAPIALRPVGTQ